MKLNSLTVEFVAPANIRNGEALLRSLAQAAAAYGDRPLMRVTAQCRSQWLVLYGVGAPGQDEVRKKQLARAGCRVIHWDAPYFSRGRRIGYFRVAVDTDHPQQWLDATPDEPSRWAAHKVSMREDYDCDGPIILAGLGKKAREYLKAQNWEAQKLEELRRRFPKRRIIYRPKPKHPSPQLIGVTTDSETPIEDLLKGCSLVVSRHSNVSVDAAIAGVPFECDDGAARWLVGKPYTAENRLSFLRRLSWWQWKAEEAAQAWAFLRSVVR